MATTTTRTAAQTSPAINERALNSLIDVASEGGVDKSAPVKASKPAPVLEAFSAPQARLNNGPELWARRGVDAASLGSALQFHKTVFARVQVPAQKIADVGSDRPVTRAGDTVMATLTFRKDAGKLVVEGHGSKATVAADGSFTLPLRGGSLTGRALAGKVEVSSLQVKFEKAAGERKDLGDMSSGLGANWIGLTVKSTGNGIGVMEVNHPQTNQRVSLEKYTAFNALSAKSLLAVFPNGPINQTVACAIDAGITSSEGGMQANDRDAKLNFVLTGDKLSGLNLEISSQHGGRASGTLREDGRFFLRNDVAAPLQFVVSGLVTQTGVIVFDHMFEEFTKPNVIPVQQSRLTDAGLRKAVAGQGTELGLFKSMSYLTLRVAQR